jgi:DNA mismatch endonuclease (patch repair protein)
MALVRARISGWRMNCAELPGRPDFWFASQRLAVFVDGDFWHGNVVGFRKPKTRTAFWCRKIDENRERDRRVNRCLKRMGIRLVRIWESDIRSDTQLGAVVRALTSLIQVTRPF